MNIRISGHIASVTPSATLALTAKAGELKAKGVDVCSFTAGEPDFDTPEHVRRAASDALLKGGAVCYYTAGNGTAELRKAVAAKFRRENSLDYNPAQIIVCTGAKQALFNAIAALAGPGDEVLIPAPYWVSYPDMALAVGAKPVPLDCSRNENFAPAGKQIRAALTPNTRALILNSPGNPTGGVFSREQFADIYAALEGTDIVVISDEIYEHLIYDGATHVSPASLGADAFARTVTINGLSKSFAMTGWRIGFAAGPARLIEAMNTLQSHTTSNAATVSQIGALAALTGDQSFVSVLRESFRKRRDLMVGGLAALPGVECAVPRGAFYAFPRVSGLYERAGVKTSAAFCEKLLEAEAVVAVPGSAFGADDFIRLSYAVAEERIRVGLERMTRFVSSL